jgi:PAS domain S-box-containing protein
MRDGCRQTAGVTLPAPGEAAVHAAARERAILASTLDPVIVIDFSGTIRSASDSVRRVFGWEPGELLGRPVNVLMPEPYRSAHDGYLVEYRRTGRTGILGRPRELEAVRRDGTVFPVEVCISRAEIAGEEPLFVGIIRDITRQKQAEQELQLLKNLALSIAKAPDLESAMTTALQQICQVTGWSYGEAWLPDEKGLVLHGTPVWHAAGETVARFHQLTRSARFARGEGLPGRVWDSRLPEWIEDLSDEPIFQRAAAAAEAGLHAGVGVPIVSGDRVVAVVCFFMNGKGAKDRRSLELLSAAVAPLGPAIERKRAEDQLRRHREHLEELVVERTSELESSHEQLRLADRLASIGTLAAGVGHDMSNVLLPLRCRLDALDAASLPPATAGHFQAVRKSIDYLQQLADGLHLLALDPEDTEATGGGTRLADWWDQVGPLLARGLPKTVRFATSWPSDLPPLAVPPHRLTQAVLNLLVNAGEAVEAKGKVRIWAEPGPPGFVRLGVTDDGHGMTPEVKRRALDPFFTTKKRGLGTGLGLSLVQGVARSAGGSVSIDSEAGRGTTVVLTLPIHEPARPDAGRRQEPQAVVGLRDPRIGSLVRTMLAAAGYRVRGVGAEPGDCALWVTDPTEEALRLARARRGGRILVLGPATPDWVALGAVVAEDPEDFEGLRDRIHDLATGAVS